MDQVHEYPEQQHYGPTVLDEMIVVIGGMMKDYSGQIELPTSIDGFSEIISEEMRKFHDETEDLSVFRSVDYLERNNSMAVNIALDHLRAVGILNRTMSGISFDQEKLEKRFNQHAFVIRTGHHRDQLDQFSHKLAQALTL